MVVVVLPVWTFTAVHEVIEPDLGVAPSARWTGMGSLRGNSGRLSRFTRAMSIKLSVAPESIKAVATCVGGSFGTNSAAALSVRASFRRRSLGLYTRNDGLARDKARTRSDGGATKAKECTL